MTRNCLYHLHLRIKMLHFGIVLFFSIPSAANLVYLDLAKQKKLGYAVNTLLQQNNYARKAIGYIYAIQV